MPRGASELVVILWRDIPAQVNAQIGRDRHQVILSGKFQRAIDRAKRKARIHTAQDDVAQWRRRSARFDGDPAAAAHAEADRLEELFTRERLGLLAFGGGWEAAVAGEAPPQEELEELEELDDDELDDEVPEDKVPEDDVPEDDVPEDDVPEDEVLEDEARPEEEQ